MPWNPQIPPSHNQGTNYHPWDGLRFVLVKLDNESLHIQKTRWAAYAQLGDGETRRFAGSAGGVGGGYTNKLYVDRGGNSSSCDVQSSGKTWIGNSSGAALTSFGNQGTNYAISACIPWFNITSGTSNTARPSTGWRKMIDCVSGWDGVTGESSQWINFQHMARPNVSNYVCSSNTGGPLNYAIDPGDMHSTTSRNYIPSGSSQTIANNGKGVYNDSLWFHENQFSNSNLTAVPWAAPNSGGGLYSSPSNANPIPWTNKSVYATGGWTMYDIVDQSAIFYANFSIGCRPDNCGVDVSLTIETDFCAGTNVIYGAGKGLTNQIDWNMQQFEATSYYAIIVFPTSPDFAANPTQHPIIQDTKFVLHHDMDSVAIQKIFGENHHMATYTGNSLGFDMSQTYVGMTPNSPYPGDYTNMAYSNTGRTHNLSSDTTWNGASVLVDTVNNISNTTYDQISYATSNEDWFKAIGGILDGEFVSLNDSWWHESGNPWNINILNEYQKALIVNSAFDRYDPAFTPVTITDKQACIFVTKTPAAGTHYNSIHDLNFFQQQDEVTEDDNPYFNLHITRNGDTVVLKDVATGFQDKGREMMAQYYGGLARGTAYNSEGMTIAGQFIKDWKQGAGTLYRSPHEMPMLSIQSAGFDSLIADEHNRPSQNANLDLSTSTSGTARGAFFSFDARIYGEDSGTTSSFRASKMYYTNAAYPSSNWSQQWGISTNQIGKGLHGAIAGFGSTMNTGMNAYGGATFTDQSYEVVYMGITKGWQQGGGSISYGFTTNLAAPFSGTNWQIFIDTLRHSTTADHGEGIYCWPTDGNIEWPNNFINDDLNFGKSGPSPWQNNTGQWGGMNVLHTNHATKVKNRWAFRTGNGLCYNSHVVTPCPTPPPGSPWIMPGQCAGGGSYVHLASGTSLTNQNQTLYVYDANGNVVYTESFTGNTVYTTNPVWLALPQGTYTYTWESPLCTPPIYFTGTLNIPAANPTIDFSHDVGSMTILDPTTCSSNDGSIIGAFNASNISGAPLTVDNNNLTWTLYKFNTVTLLYDYVNHDHPFLSTANGGLNSNYTNGSGSTGTGLAANGCIGINPLGASCSGTEYSIANNLDDGCYRLILFQNVDQLTLQTYTDPSGHTYNNFTDPAINGPLMACMEIHDFCLTCTNSGTCNCTGTSTATCHILDDEDQGNNGAWTGLIPNNGYINGSPNQPTDVGSVTGVMTGGTAPFDFVVTNSAGTIVGQLLNTLLTTYTINGFPPDTYTYTVTDTNGIIVTSSHTINAPIPLSWITQPTVTNPTCNQTNGVISGGVGDSQSCAGALEYCLSISNTAVWDTIISDEWVVEGTTAGVAAVWGSATTFASVAPGLYYVWFRNACGCAIPSALMTVTSGVNLSGVITNSAAACTGTIPTLTATISSGTAPYSYVWSSVTTGTNGIAEPGFIVPVTTSATYTQVTLGAYDYEVFITDSQGCTLTLTYSTVSAGALNLSAVVSQIGCSGGTGSIDTTVSGGTAAYTYQWSGSSTATTADLTSLAAGTYTVVVTDAVGCTATATYIIALTQGLEEFIDLNQYEYNSIYGLTQTGTAYEDAWYGKYGGPTCATGDDGTIRLILDSTSSVGGAAFPYDVEISNDGGATYWPVRNNAGTVYTGANGLTTADAYDSGTGFLLSTGVAYDHVTDGMVAGTYFELQGGTGGDEWNPGGGYVDLPFTAGSVWHFRLTENGTSCIVYTSTTILNSDYQNVDVGTNTASIVTDPTCCGCSSYGASTLGTCNGDIDITPTLGTYEDHTNVTYSYLWTYAGLTSTCTVPGHINVNTMWANQTTQDLTLEWPGAYTVVVTDSCSGTDTETLNLPDPVVYVDDITWTHPLCAGCCDGTMTVTAHGGTGNLEVSVDNRQNWTTITGGSVILTGLCDGIHNVWVRDDSACTVEYFADPDDIVYGSSFDDHCFSDADITGILNTSGTWTPSNNSNVMTTPTPAAYTGVNFTRIQLTAASNFIAANACVISHNLFPGGTDGEITLNLVGGNPPYTISMQTLIGPVYNPSTGIIPCAGISPLSTLIDPCTLTGLPIPGNNLAGTSIITVTENTSGTLTQWANVPSTGFVSSETSFTFEQVSVSRDLNSSALGAEYLITVQDSTGCVNQGQIGMDNGMFNLVSIYGAENCDCICPLGFTLDTDPGSPTYEECISNVMDPLCYNGTQGYWSLYTYNLLGGVAPSNWGSLGAALYGPWIGGAVSYGTAVSLNLATLPLKKDIITITANLLYNDNTSTPQLGVDLALWNTVGLTSYINNRIPDIAVFLTQPGWPIAPPPPPIPTGEWIGHITEVNFPAPVETIICMASDEKMRMTVDGSTYIEMNGDDTIGGTVTSNSDHFNLFPIILPAGIHTIAFEVHNTTGHGFMAYDVISSTMSTGNVFVAECLAPTYNQAFHEANLILDVNGIALSSKNLNGEEVLLGSSTYGYSCCNSVTTLNMDPFCTSSYNAWVAQGSNVYSSTGLYYPGQVVSYIDPTYGVVNYFVASATSGGLFVPPANIGNPQLYPAPVAPNVCCYGAGCTCTGAALLTYYWEGCGFVASSGSTISTPSISNGNLFCTSSITAPCEVPLDCGYCVDVNGNPAPQWTEKGPCEDADNGGLPTPVSLDNEWITDVSALSDLVECPAALANIAYSKFEGGLGTDLMDIRCAWLVIMIKYMLKNLNVCFTLSDIQDVFAGFLDEICPTCKVKKALTPAEMAAITNMFTLNTNVTFDF